jgi:hypothetical protein
MKHLLEAARPDLGEEAQRRMQPDPDLTTDQLHQRVRPLGMDPQHRLRVSPQLRADFSNGDQLYAKAGQVIDLPQHQADRPGREFLEWHLDEVFFTAVAT